MINVNQLFAAKQNTDVVPTEKVNTGYSAQFSQVFGQQRADSQQRPSSPTLSPSADKAPQETARRQAQTDSTATERRTGRRDSDEDNSVPRESHSAASDQPARQQDVKQNVDNSDRQAVQQSADPKDRQSNSSKEHQVTRPADANEGASNGSVKANVTDQQVSGDKSRSVGYEQPTESGSATGSTEETDWVAFVNKNIELTETLAHGSPLAAVADEQLTSVSSSDQNLGLLLDNPQILESSEELALKLDDAASGTALKTDLLAALESLGIHQLAAGSIKVSDQLPELTALDNMTPEQLLTSLDAMVDQLSEWQAQLMEGGSPDLAQVNQGLLNAQEVLTYLAADTGLSEQLSQQLQQLSDKLSSVLTAFDRSLVVQPAVIDGVSSGLSQSGKEVNGSTDNLNVRNLTQWSAEWNDVQQQQYLERLKESVSAVVPGLNNDTKGSEFIVALQTGLEEVKKQAKLGREPGIDLQALVQNALEQVEQPLSKGQLESLQRVVAGQQQTPNPVAGLQQQIEKVQAMMTPDERNDISKLDATQSVEQRAGAASLSGSNNQQSPLDKAINLTKPEGQQQLMEKVRWMMNSRTMAAEIQLDPADLGAMQIRIALNGDVASINFTVQNNQTRDLLAQAQSQLQAMLADQGLSLGQSHVNQESQGQADGGSRDPGGSSSDALSADDPSEQGATEIIEQSISGGTIGGINVYA